MKAFIVLGNVSDKLIAATDFSNSLIVGVEDGCNKLMKLHHNFIALGDFDSVTNFKKISNKSQKLVHLPREKDDTDTAYAVKYLINLGYNDITILGGINGFRCEHFIANVILLNNYPQLIMKDDNSYLMVKENDFTLQNEYQHVNFFALKDSIISIKGLKYELDNYLLKPFDPLTISNSFINEEAFISVQGKVLVILTNE